MAALPVNPETHGYLFTDDMRFLQKAVVIHPTDEDKFLIIKRHTNECVRPDTWDLPGGCVLYGETHMTSLKREITEETGLDVSNLQPVYVNTKYASNQPMYFLLIAFRGKATSEDIALSAEHSAYQWVRAQQFINLDPSYHYAAERELNINNTDFLRDIVSAAFNK
jgi:8-oxo-dGTP pyrophosphatase MutT (NUDIX family)